MAVKLNQEEEYEMMRVSDDDMSLIKTEEDGCISNNNSNNNNDNNSNNNSNNNSKNKGSKGGRYICEEADIVLEELISMETGDKRIIWEMLIGTEKDRIYKLFPDKRRYMAYWSGTFNKNICKTKMEKKKWILRKKDKIWKKYEMACKMEMELYRSKRAAAETAMKQQKKEKERKIKMEMEIREQKEVARASVVKKESVKAKKRAKMDALTQALDKYENLEQQFAKAKQAVKDEIKKVKNNASGSSDADNGDKRRRRRRYDSRDYEDNSNDNMNSHGNSYSGSDIRAKWNNKWDNRTGIRAPICNGCHRIGHLKRQCPHLNFMKDRCFGCGKLGHWRRHCRKPTFRQQPRLDYGPYNHNYCMWCHKMGHDSRKCREKKYRDNIAADYWRYHQPRDSDSEKIKINNNDNDYNNNKNNNNVSNNNNNNNGVVPRKIEEHPKKDAKKEKAPVVINLIDDTSDEWEDIIESRRNNEKVRKEYKMENKIDLVSEPSSVASGMRNIGMVERTAERGGRKKEQQKPNRKSIAKRHRKATEPIRTRMYAPPRPPSRKQYVPMKEESSSEDWSN